MQPANASKTSAFSGDSIEEVEQVTYSKLEVIDEQVPLIEGFKQPFPLRERGKPVVDGEMDSYG